MVCFAVSKLRGYDLVRLKVSDIYAFGHVKERASILQSKTQKPVQFEITEGTRASVERWMDEPLMLGSEYLWPGRFHGWNIFQTGWTGDAMMSPITNFYVTGACEDAWYGWHCDEQIQELRSAFVDAQTEAERLSVAEAIQERAFEIVSVVIMGQFVDPAAWCSDLRGIEEFPIFTNLWGVTRRCQFNHAHTEGEAHFPTIWQTPFLAQTAEKKRA